MAELLTRRQVCQALGVSEKTIYSWEKSGRVPPPARDHRGWRRYGPKDVERIRRVLGVVAETHRDAAEPDSPHVLEGLSARNQLVGKVVAIRREGLLAEIALRLGDGQEIVSVITTKSVRRLGLAVGKRATAVVKSTEVMLYL
ncbi:MAG: TOBE domain-containing protein [bacterium]